MCVCYCVCVCVCYESDDFKMSNSNCDKNGTLSAFVTSHTAGRGNASSHPTLIRHCAIVVIQSLFPVTPTFLRAGLRHVRDVRPNRAPSLGAAILDPGLAFILPFCLPKNQKCCNQMRLASIQCSKCDAGGAYSAPPGPLACFKGPLTSRRGGGGDGRGREGKGRIGAGREGNLTLMRSWNRAADWLRPALTVLHSEPFYPMDSTHVYLCLRLAVYTSGL